MEIGILIYDDDKNNIKKQQLIFSVSCVSGSKLSYLHTSSHLILLINSFQRLDMA